MSDRIRNHQKREGEAPAEPQTSDIHNSLPVRKHPVHGIKADADGPIILFDTICTKDRNPWLATKPVHDLLRNVWREASAWLVGRYHGW